MNGFAQRIVDLIADPQRREQMGRYGRERVESALNWSVEAPKLLAAYDRALQTTAVRDRRQQAYGLTAARICLD